MSYFIKATLQFSKTLLNWLYVCQQVAKKMSSFIIWLTLSVASIIWVGILLLLTGAFQIFKFTYTIKNLFKR